MQSVITLIAVLAVIFLVWGIVADRKGSYSNALRLYGIPIIEEFRPAIVRKSHAENDEFAHIAETLEQWQLQSKSIADYVQDEEHKKGLLLDFAILKKKAELDLIAEKLRPGEEQLGSVIRRREVFLKHADLEVARIQRWKPIPKQEYPIDFREFNAKATISVLEDGVRKVATGATIYIFEEGDFVVWQLLESNQKRELAQVIVTGETLGQPLRVIFERVEASRLVLFERKTNCQESKVL